MTTLQQIRKAYDVPARRGREVLFRGERARILSATRQGMHLWLEVGTSAVARVRVHPLWAMDYLDGRGVR